MSVIRNQFKSSFTQIPNSLIVDNQLSNGAKMVAIYLFSKPDNWEVNNADIMKNLDIARRETIANYWKELIKTGWITRVKKCGEGSICGGYDYNLNIAKNEDDVLINSTSPCTEKPYTPHVRKNRTHNNTDLNNNTEYEKTTGKKDVAISEKPKVESQFDDFWLAYPKRDGSNPKHPAKLKFDLAVKAGANPDLLIDAAKRYSQHCTKSGSFGTEYVKQAVTWINQKCWEDDLPVVKVATEKPLTRPEDIAQPQGIVEQTSYDIFLAKKKANELLDCSVACG